MHHLRYRTWILGIISACILNLQVADTPHGTIFILFDVMLSIMTTVGSWLAWHVATPPRKGRGWILTTHASMLLFLAGLSGKHDATVPASLIYAIGALILILAQAKNPVIAWIRRPIVWIDHAIQARLRAYAWIRGNGARHRARKAWDATHPNPNGYTTVSVCVYICGIQQYLAYTINTRRCGYTISIGRTVYEALRGHTTIDMDRLPSILEAFIDTMDSLTVQILSNKMHHLHIHADRYPKMGTHLYIEYTKTKNTTHRYKVELDDILPPEQQQARARRRAREQQDIHAYQPKNTVNPTISARRILNVGANATLKECEQAYRAKARVYHPDRVTSHHASAQAFATQEMCKINDAIAILRRHLRGT